MAGIMAPAKPPNPPIQSQFPRPLRSRAPPRTSQPRRHSLPNRPHRDASVHLTPWYSDAYSPSRGRHARAYRAARRPLPAPSRSMCPPAAPTLRQPGIPRRLCPCNRSQPRRCLFTIRFSHLPLRALPTFVVHPLLR